MGKPKDGGLLEGRATASCGLEEKISGLKLLSFVFFLVTYIYLLFPLLLFSLLLPRVYLLPWFTVDTELTS